MKRVLKWTGIALGALVVLIGLALVAVYFASESMLSQTYAIPPETITVVEGDSAVLAEGLHQARILGCFECHGENLAGQVMGDEPPFRIVASNLTPGQGGIGAAYTDQDWIRALRHGVAPDGRPLLVMPTKAFNNVNRADLGKLISYLKSLEPVENVLPPTEIRMLGRAILVASGGGPAYALKIDHTRPAPEPVERAATREYGAYLASTTCKECHGDDMAGGPHPNPSAPAVPGLVAAAAWPLDGFVAAMRTGVTPAGTELDPHFMPWHSFRHMTDEEIEALHLYLRELPLPAPPAP